MPNSNGTSKNTINRLAVIILCAALSGSFIYSTITNYRLQSAVETIIELKGDIKVLNTEVTNLKQYNTDIKTSLDKLNGKIDEMAENLSEMVTIHREQEKTIKK